MPVVIFFACLFIPLFPAGDLEQKSSFIYGHYLSVFKKKKKKYMLPKNQRFKRDHHHNIKKNPINPHDICQSVIIDKALNCC